MRKVGIISRHLVCCFTYPVINPDYHKKYHYTAIKEMQLRAYNTYLTMVMRPPILFFSFFQFLRYDHFGRACSTRSVSSLYIQ